jgi:hypothetical protein
MVSLRTFMAFILVTNCSLFCSEEKTFSRHRKTLSNLTPLQLSTITQTQSQTSKQKTPENIPKRPATAPNPKQ